MSGGDGAKVSRGTASHKSVDFTLVGAVYLSSILPGRMQPQDRSRFAHLQLGTLPVLSSPGIAAAKLTSLEASARDLGPKVVRRMLEQAPRWDATHAFYSDFLQNMGGEPRDGDTLGAVLTGWDLMLYDTAPDIASDQANRLVKARAIARPLIGEAVAARHEGEGESCLKHLLTHQINLQVLGTVSLGELIGEAIGRKQRSADLERHGLRYRPDKSDLIIASGEHKALHGIFRGTRWSEGGHVEALLSLDGVSRPENPLRLSGSKYRVIAIPAMHLPESDESGTVT